MTKTYSSEILSDIHESASDLWEAGIISQDSMEQFNRLCLSPEVSGESCVPDIIELMEPMDVEFIAEKVYANATLVSKVLDRKIVVETIPVSFLSSLANEFGVPYEHLIEYLIIESDIQSSDLSNYLGKFSMKKKRQSFEEAVCSSSLTELKQRNLLSLINIDQISSAAKTGYITKNQSQFNNITDSFFSNDDFEVVEQYFGEDNYGSNIFGLTVEKSSTDDYWSIQPRSKDLFIFQNIELNRIDESVQEDDRGSEFQESVVSIDSIPVKSNELDELGSFVLQEYG